MKSKTFYGYNSLQDDEVKKFIQDKRVLNVRYINNSKNKVSVMVIYEDGDCSD